MTADPRIIAVYGTLRSGYGNDRLWRGRAHSMGLGYVIGYALVSNGGFPYALPATMAQSVVELIVPDPDAYDVVLRAMDYLEGYVPGSPNNHYERITTAVMTADGPRLAWMYVGSEWVRNEHLPDCPTNEAGRFDWAEYRLARHHHERNTR